jgi:hypothetical protein
MKQLFTFCFLTLSLFSTAQNTGQLGIFTSVLSPDKAIMPKMSVNYSIGFNMAYSPFPRTPFYLELKSSWGNYSYKTLTQTYTFTDGSTTVTDVNYSSGMSSYLLGGKVMVGKELWKVRGFITPQIGLTKLRSRIYIEDPQDEDNCKPLENRVTQKFTGGVYGGEVGFEIDMGQLLYGNEPYTHKLVLTMNFLGSFNHMNYVNIKHMENEVHDPTVIHEDRDINATFVNVGSNSLHEHKIAELYHTPLNFWGFTIGYTRNF